MRVFTVAKLTAGLLVCAALVAAGAPAVAEHDQAATHVLNRLAYGPRAGDVAAVRAMGVAAWIERQLHPERISDAALDGRLAPLTTLTLDAATIVRDYDRPAVQERRQRQRAKAEAPDAATVPQSDAPATDAPADDPRPALSPAQRKNRTVLADLEDAKILRAVYSERQLEAVLVDVWFNHFNVFAGKGPTRSYVTEYERDVIRPHVLGRFRELLGATAKSPAMLFYLDNWRNVARGLNENYARELLELHTLGVDGGYTQQDVVNVARAFTGWTMRPRAGSGFRFAAALHDRAAKMVLGHAIGAGGGIEDGEQVLDLLAAHPRTAHLIATTLARRFVSDTPPSALVDRAAARFLATRGDLREVVRVIVTSPEFFAPAAAQSKLKTPFEFVVSALRAAGADVRNARPLARTLRELGMPLFFCQPPTGYDDTAEAWASAGALVSRVNFALALGANGVRGSRLPSDAATRAAVEAIGSPAFRQR